MRSKQVGQSAEYNKLYDIHRKLEQIIRISPHIGWNTGQSGLVLDSDYQAVLTYAALQGYSRPSASQQIKQNQLVLDLKAAGVWTLIDVIYIYATDGDTNYARLNWKNASLYITELVGTPTFATNQGFNVVGSSGNYLRLGFNTVTNAINFLQDSCSFGLWLDSYTSGLSLAGYQTSQSIRMLYQNTTGHRLNTISALSGGVADLTGTGYKALNRSSSTNCELYNQVTSFARTATSSAKASEKPTLGLYSGQVLTGRYSMAYLGGSLTSGMHNSIRSAFNTYKTSL
jgi:hypothetical protein